MKSWQTAASRIGGLLATESISGRTVIPGWQRTRVPGSERAIGTLAPTYNPRSTVERRCPQRRGALQSRTDPVSRR
jgi:hypothetical protein